MDQRADVLQNLYSLRDFLRWACSRFHEKALFFGHGTDNAWDEAVQLVMHALHLPAQGDQRFLDARLTEAEKHAVLDVLDRRIYERVPAPYITGEAWFAGLPFHVDERVLIPRSPLGELIENGFEPWLPFVPERILDLCTGSGCIGIACAHLFEDAAVVLSDISTDALAVARDNIARHGLGDRVTAVGSDLFDAMPGECFDLIISNPPYVDAGDFNTLPEEFRHEPALALASGDDGLDFTRRLLAEAADHLTPEGILIVEVGNSWPALEEAFPQLPFTWLEFERGGHGVFLLHRRDLPGGG
jgi:ribosomal protein L3 glutamine methyltransferase